MPSGYSIEVEGSERAMKALKSFIVDDEHFENVEDEVFRHLRHWQRKVFDTRGRAAGHVWPGETEREEVYYWIKSQILGSAQIGSFEGGGRTPELRWARGNEKLFPSLTYPSHPKGIRRTVGTSWVFGTKSAGAAKHQEGGRRNTAKWGGSYTVPARPFITGDPDVPELNDALRGITRAMRREMGL